MLILQVHESIPSATGLRNRSFPHYNELTLTFGKDRAIGSATEDHTDMAQTIKREEVETNENDSLANRNEPNRPIRKKKNIANPIAAISNNPSRTSIAASTRKKRVKN